MNFYKYNIIKEKICTMVHLFVLVFVFDFVLAAFSLYIIAVIFPHPRGNVLKKARLTIVIIKCID